MYYINITTFDIINQIKLSFFRKDFKNNINKDKKRGTNHDSHIRNRNQTGRQHH